MIEKKLYTVEEVKDFINQGKIMMLSGSADAIKDLPKGKWIAGTCPYFMSGVGKIDKQMIMVDDFSDIASNVCIESFDENNIEKLCEKSYDNGFNVIILPFQSPVYYKFATDSMKYEGVFNNPLVGYVACCLFEEIGKVNTYTSTGLDSKLSDKNAVVMHIELPKNLVARTEILDLDTIDENSKSVVFPKDGFAQKECLIDGKPGVFSDFLKEYRDTTGRISPIICNMNGALVNRDVNSIDWNTGDVTFFSPAYEGDVYYMSKQIGDYQQLMNEAFAKKKNVSLCISCGSYYLGGDLTGKNVSLNGVYAFGEIAFQLLNKTIVTLEIDEI